jgi:hypothetical protein
MRLLTALGLATLLLSGGCASGLTEEDLVTLRADIRSQYEERADVVEEVFLEMRDGEASGFVRWYAAGETYFHDCTVTVYDNGQISWSCGP